MHRREEEAMCVNVREMGGTMKLQGIDVIKLAEFKCLG